jgi:UDP-3-O-[3-hydroxymyristoyl] glucosamine N-acyltransferase
VAGLEDATHGQLSFVTGPKFAAAYAASAASAFLVPPEFDTLGRPCLVSWSPYVYFARAVELFHPRAVPPPGVHETAIVAEDVLLGKDVSIGACAVIGAGARRATAAVCIRTRPSIRASRWARTVRSTPACICIRVFAWVTAW